MVYTIVNGNQILIVDFVHMKFNYVLITQCDTPACQCYTNLKTRSPDLRNFLIFKNNINSKMPDPEFFNRVPLQFWILLLYFFGVWQHKILSPLLILSLATIHAGGRGTYFRSNAYVVAGMKCLPCIICRQGQCHIPCNLTL